MLSTDNFYQECLIASVITRLQRTRRPSASHHHRRSLERRRQWLRTSPATVCRSASFDLNPSCRKALRWPRWLLASPTVNLTPANKPYCIIIWIKATFSHRLKCLHCGSASTRPRASTRHRRRNHRTMSSSRQHLAAVRQCRAQRNFHRPISSSSTAGIWRECHRWAISTGRSSRRRRSRKRHRDRRKKLSHKNGIIKA